MRHKPRLPEWHTHGCKGLARVDEFELVREIGRGSFGIVYEAVRKATGEHVAIKRFHINSPGQNDIADLRARFRREVKYQKTIDHENVVRIFEHDIDSPDPWFVMELANCSLADELVADRTLGGKPEKALYDILAGLEVVHAKGFVHRDLKPQNVLRYTQSDGEARYAISDFGLMHVGDAASSSLTSTNMGGGTERYAAPECMMNMKRATAAADIYSFGAVLHDIFGGGALRIPCQELTAAPPIGSVIEGCTKNLALRRFPSVASVRDALFQAFTSANVTFASFEEERAVELLSEQRPLTPAEWDHIFLVVDKNDGSWQKNLPVFRFLMPIHIDQLAHEAPPLFRSLALDFAAFAATGVFDFGYCDVIAERAVQMFTSGELDVQATIALATLRLGTSHNRWSVERRFLGMAGPNISDDLAGRIAAEIDAQDLDFEHEILRMEASISATRNDLHPILQSLIPPLPNG
jgi:serine/threonine protein kinase